MQAQTVLANHTVSIDARTPIAMFVTRMPTSLHWDEYGQHNARPAYAFIQKTFKVTRAHGGHDSDLVVDSSFSTFFQYHCQISIERHISSCLAFPLRRSDLVLIADGDGIIPVRWIFGSLLTYPLAGHDPDHSSGVERRDVPASQNTIAASR